jgi:hypothetical protein
MTKFIHISYRCDACREESPDLDAQNFGNGTLPVGWDWWLMPSGDWGHLCPACVNLRHKQAELRSEP